MPSYTFDPLTVAAMNEEDAKAFLQNLKADKDATITPPQTSTSGAPDPSGSRNVTAEGKAELQAASTSAPDSRIPPPPKAFARTSERSAANAIRLTLGSDPYRVKTWFGDNNFIPDFTSLFNILSACDNIMLSTDKFTRASEFWTPAVSRSYIGVICIIQTFRAMRQGRRNLTVNQQEFLDWFEERYPLSTLPIPGPLVNLISVIANTNVAALNYRSHCPVLPDVAPANYQNATYLRNNLCLRIPNIPIILHQLFRHATFATTPIAGADPTSAQVGRWPLFMRHLYEITPITTDPPSQTNKGTHGHTTVAYAWNFFNPALVNVYRTNNNIGKNLLDYADELISILPASATRTTASTDNHALTWQEFCCLDSQPKWFEESARLMSLYSKFWKESCSLEDISPVGHAGALGHAAITAQLVQPTTRFPAQTFSMNYELRSHTVSEADRLDGLIANINVANRGAVTAHTGSANVAVQSGPYYSLAVTHTARSVDPTSAIGQILEDQYHVPNPKA